jgi:hypothetical protein
MTEYVSHPAEGIERLIIEEMAADAQLLGADVAEIEIQHLGDATSEALEYEEDALYFRGASARRVIVPPGIAVTVQRARGDLRVAGLEAGLDLEDVQGTLRLAELTGPVRLGHVAADVRAANIADLHIALACDGDLRLEASGSLSGELVAGDVRLHDVGSVRLGRVRGDLWIERVRGALQLRRADGDVRISEVDGPVALQEILGDLRVATLPGGISATQVSGDVILNGPFTAEDGYELSADGDTGISLPAEADVRLVLRAGGRVRSDVTLTPTADGSPTYTAVLGRGSTRVNLTTGGDLRVAQAGARPGARAGRAMQYDDLADLRNLGERIRQQVQASLAAAGIASRDGEVSVRRERPRPPVERARSAAARAASAEEQMAILKMVETGVISPEEADVLLRALEA